MKNDTHPPPPLPSLGEHYSQLLGLVAPWSIRDVDLDVEKATLDIHVVEEGAVTFPCPECSARGFRNFAHYRIAILFFCGKMEMHPQ